MRSLRNPFSLRRSPTAFTLVELIISIGMVLILMAGVVKVFKYATDAVGAGLAVSDIVRASARSLATQIPADTAGLNANQHQLLPCNVLLDSQQNDSSIPRNPAGTPIATVLDTNTAIQGPILSRTVVQGPPYL